MKMLFGAAVASLALFAGSALAQAPNDAQIASHRRHRQPGRHRRRQARRDRRAATPTSRRSASRWSPTTRGVNKQAVALVTKLKVTPEDNPTSQSLSPAAKRTSKNLKKLKGEAFDKAYIDHEVAYHQQVLDAIDKTLMPSAQERGAEGADRQGAAGVRRAPRARQDAAGSLAKI